MTQAQIESPADIIRRKDALIAGLREALAHEQEKSEDCRDKWDRAERRITDLLQQNMRLTEKAEGLKALRAALDSVAEACDEYAALAPTPAFREAFITIRDGALAALEKTK